MSSMSSSVSGAMPTATSPSTSTSLPPRPTRTSGPSKGSWLTPTIISCPDSNLLLHEQLRRRLANSGGLEVGADRPHCICGFSRRRHPEPDAADFALVDRGRHLDDDSAPELDLGRRSLSRGAHAPCAGHGNAICIEQRLRVDLPPASRGSSGGTAAFDEPTNLEGVDFGPEHLADRAAAPLFPCDAQPEGAGRVLREHERRDSRL